VNAPARRSFPLFVLASVLSFGVDVGLFCLLRAVLDGLPARLFLSIAGARAHYDSGDMVGIESAMDLILELIGANRVAGLRSDDDSCGIAVLGCLTVVGSGTLTAVGGKADHSSWGLFVGDRLNVLGGLVLAAGGEAAGDSYGLAAAEGVFVSGGQVIAAGGVGASASCGMASNGSLVVTGGRVRAIGGEAGADSCGIAADIGAQTTGGRITAAGKTRALARPADLSGFAGFLVTVNADPAAEGARSWDGRTALGGEESPYRYVDIFDGAYLISFNAAGGAVTPASALTGADGRLAALPAPARAGGYSFEGWYTAPTGGEAVTADTVFAADVVIYARWIYTGLAPACRLRFETNGGSAIADVTASSGAVISLAEYAPVRSGYQFTGWYADRALKEKLTEIRLAGDSTVYAGWAVKNPFNDVTRNDYFHDAVLWALTGGVTAGTSSTTFSPADICTRAQMVTFLWRAAGSPSVRGTMPFADVPEGAYYYDAVLWAAGSGIARGVTATRFAPEERCDRAQAMTFLWRSAI